MKTENVQPDENGDLRATRGPVAMFAGIHSILFPAHPRPHCSVETNLGFATKKAIAGTCYSSLFFNPIEQSRRNQWGKVLIFACRVFPYDIHRRRKTIRDRPHWRMRESATIRQIYWDLF
jgi:hypothetical protein